MLRSDIKLLKVILSRLFIGFNFFKVKSDNKVIIKKRFWSLHKHTYTLKDLFMNVIPSTILDSEISRAYADVINGYINTNDVSSTLKSIYDIFITYIQNEKDYKGVCLETTTLYDRIKKHFKSIPAFRPGSLIQRHDEITFITVEETIREKIHDTAKRIVGRVCTGNEKFDMQFAEICRYNIA